MIYITLAEGVNIYNHLRNDEVVRVGENLIASSMRPAGRKTEVKIFGLHPNTTDAAVIGYLTAHGTVSKEDPPVRHVYKNTNSILDGKENGTRGYFVELKRPMGSYHIIDGEKVTVRYPGQEFTCGRCQRFKRDCPGKAVARDCEEVEGPDRVERVYLSDHMIKYWEEIGYKPEAGMNWSEEVNVQEYQQDPSTDPSQASPHLEDLSEKHTGVIIDGFFADDSIEEVRTVLVSAGMSDTVQLSQISKPATGSKRHKKKIQIVDLAPDQCQALRELSTLSLSENRNRNITVKPLVRGDSPKDDDAAPDRKKKAEDSPSALRPAGSDRRKLPKQ